MRMVAIRSMFQLTTERSHMGRSMLILGGVSGSGHLRVERLNLKQGHQVYRAAHLGHLILQWGRLMLAEKCSEKAP